LVAVRLKSTRLPRKALRDLAGEPLIIRLTERVRKAMLPERVVWCTSTHHEDDLLEDLGRARGIEVHRGSELDVLSRFLEVAGQREARTVIRITGDNPLTDPEMMDVMLHAHAQANADYTYNDDLPRGTRCEVIAAAALEKCHRLARDPSASEYMTLMLRRPDRFKVRKVEAPVPELRRPEVRLTVDTPEDFSVVSAIYEAFTGEPPPLIDILAWLDAHPEIAARNQHIRPPELDVSVDVGLEGDQ